MLGLCTGTRPSPRGLHSSDANASEGRNSHDRERSSLALADSVSVCHVRSPEGAQRSIHGLDGSWEPVVSTRVESSPTSDAFCHDPVVVRRFPYDSRQPSPVSFRRPEGPRRSTCSSHALSGIPNRRERSSPSLARRLVRLPSALTPVIVSIPRSAFPASSSSSLAVPEGCGASALPEVSLFRAPPVLSYDPVSLYDTRFHFCFHAHAASFSLAAKLSSVPCHTSRRAWRARSPFASRRSERAARTAHVSNIHPAGMRSGGDPGRHRPMSATHDSFFKRREPVVSVHSASRIPTRRSGSRYTPLSSQPRWTCLPVASVVLSRRFDMRSGYASSPNGSPAERSLWTTEALLHDDCVHRRSPLASRRSTKALGVPPDGLDRIRRIA